MIQDFNGRWEIWVILMGDFFYKKRFLKAEIVDNINGEVD